MFFELPQNIDTEIYYLVFYLCHSGSTFKQGYVVRTRVSRKTPWKRYHLAVRVERKKYFERRTRVQYQILKIMMI